MLPRADTPIDRRQVFRIGGLTVSFAALVAACGEDRTGDTAPGRVGYAPPVTSPPDYDVNDVVLLRTASSLEYSAIAVYEQVLGLGVLDAETTALVEELIANHQDIADEMGELTESAGGDAWECPNPWFMERLIDPGGGVDRRQRRSGPRRVQHRRRPREPGGVDAPVARCPADRTRRQAGDDGRRRAGVAPLRCARGARPRRRGLHQPGYRRRGRAPRRVRHPQRFAVTGRFGSVGQAELTVGAADENGARETFLLQTPAENSFVYSELEPTC
jgi:hypothetical protein